MAVVRLIGVLTDVFPPEFFSNFTKKVFWLKEPDTERYPQQWQLELHQNDIDRLKGIAIGDRLECEVEIRGKKWSSSRGEGVTNTLRCIGILVISRSETVAGSLGSYIPKTKAGREADKDRPKQQGELSL